METFTVPNNVAAALHFIERNWQAFLLALVAAIISSLVVEIAKRKGLKPRFNLDIPEEKKRLQKLTTYLLAGVTTVITSLGYIAGFCHWAAPHLSQYPALAEAVLGIYGASNFLYNVRLNQTWDKWASRLSSWANNAPKPLTVQATEPATTPDVLTQTAAPSEDLLS